jgi:glycosyltransferase involved in cell wall biosynthesis
MVKISVIIPTFNRNQKVQTTIQTLIRQNFPADQYEIIVVDDGSPQPVSLPEHSGHNVRLIRFDKNQERSKARSTGVEAARGDILVFVDDDLIVQPDFLEHHFQAHQEWDNLLAIGKIILPPDKLSEPGVRFRQNLEMNGIPATRGLVSQPNFCTAANMSINRKLYLRLGGFDPAITGIEDQDFALRHTAAGGKIAYMPEAVAIHDDDWLDFLSFCRRQERGAEWTVVFSRRYPDWRDSQERDMVNGRLNFGSEPLTLSTKKIIKRLLGANYGIASLAAAIKMLETVAPRSNALNQLYSITLGVYLQKGYRRGIEAYERSLQKAQWNKAVVYNRPNVSMK